MGEADQKLKAATALMMANGEPLMEAVDRHGGTADAQEVEVRAAAALATNLALEVITGLISLAGGSGVRSGSLVEQALRDIAVMTTHYVVAGSAIEHYGRALLGLPADPLG